MHIHESVVLITGAAVRVGRQIALHLAAKGAHIVFSYLNESEPWQEVVKEIEKYNVMVVAQKADIRYKKDIDQLVQTAVDQFGRIDVLINNASVWLRTPFLQISEEEWELTMDVNLKGPFLTAQAVASHMVKQNRGVIINITDLSAFQVWQGYTHHAASKAGLVSLTKSLAVELAPAVRVNAIAPGTVLLPDNALPEKKTWAEEKSLLKRIGKPQDVARMAEFLIESDFITGAVYFVDGGRSLV